MAGHGQPWSDSPPSMRRAPAREDAQSYARLVAIFGALAGFLAVSALAGFAHAMLLAFGTEAGAAARETAPIPDWARVANVAGLIVGFVIGGRVGRVHGWSSWAMAAVGAVLAWIGFAMLSLVADSLVAVGVIVAMGVWLWRQ